jgi:apolipoprotein D and lipocalin family protein
MVGIRFTGDIAASIRWMERRSRRSGAQAVNRSTNAKLEVSFFRPFWGEYWVIELGADYEYALVGHPSRDNLWILAREPSMAPEFYAALLPRLEARGYETVRLVRTVR